MKYREICWTQENQLLEHEADRIATLQKQLMVESQNDTSMQGEIHDKIFILKTVSSNLSKALEKEKYKNLELQTIVNYFHHSLYQTKKKQTALSKTNSLENLEDAKRIIQKLENSLAQFSNRTNKINQKNIQNKNKVNTSRVERLIDSTIFRNLQTELRKLEMEYKKLLIEKTLIQNSYHKSYDEYTQLKSSATELAKEGSARKTQKFKEMLEMNFKNTNQKFHKLESERKSINRPFKGGYRPSYSKKYSRNQSTGGNGEEEYLVKKMLSDTGEPDVETLIHHLGCIDEINDEIFEQTNIYTDKINKLIEETNEIETKILKKDRKFYKTQKNQLLKKERIGNLKEEIQKISTEEQYTSTNAEHFRKNPNFLSVMEIMGVEDEAYFSDFASNYIEDVFKVVDEQMHEMEAPYQQSGVTFTHMKEPESEPKLDEIISRMKKVEPTDTIMCKQDFQNQYYRLQQKKGSRKKLSKEWSSKKKL